MAYLFERVNDDFVLVDAIRPAAEVWAELQRREPPSVFILRRSYEGRILFYVRPAQRLYGALAAAIQGGRGAAALSEALALLEVDADPTADAYADSVSAPDRCVILDGARVIGFRDPAYPPPLIDKEGLPYDTGRSAARYLNSGFFAAGAERPLSTNQPLALDAGPYRLGVNVGGFWGPGAPGAAFPDAVLAPHFERPGDLELDVVASSQSVRIETPRARLLVPRSGDSPLVFFELVFRDSGRQAVDVDLIFRGHLLQSRRIEASVVAHSGEALPSDAGPAQDGYITFTRSALIDRASLAPLGARPSSLTIVTERDVSLDRISLRFYDAAGGDLGLQTSTLTDTNLARALEAVRQQLVSTMDAYTGVVGSDFDMLQKHLGLLAGIGRSFYLALLPALAGAGATDEGQRLNVELTPETVIQVAPLSAQLGVPWEVLYERKMESYREGRTKLCEAFAQHGPTPEDCPHHGDPQYVCPHGFWGYRYIVEQLPGRVDPHATPAVSTLSRQVRNQTPLRLSAIVSSELKQVDAHLAALRSLAAEALLTLERVDTLEGVRAALSEPQAGPDLLYFYTHGGADPFGRPYLKVGTADEVKLIDLDAWALDLSAHRPLVVLNACESADYSPDSFENLVQFLCLKGAAGVIGTQCRVKENLAQAMIMPFLQAFLRQAQAGKALFDARLALLRLLDPRGLAYSLFASAETQLATPVLS